MPGHRAECSRCGAVLRHFRSGSLERCAALTSAALILFVVANLFPVLTFELEGRAQSATLISGSLALWRGGFESLAILVFLVLILAPLLEMLATLYVVLPLAYGVAMPGAARAFRTAARLRPWAMAEVFLLGLIVAYVKLSDLAELTPGLSLAALLGFIVLQVWGDAALSPFDVWERLAPQTRVGQAAGADAAHLTACHDCRQVVAGSEGDCPRCGAGLHRRKPNSVQRCWALVVAATVLCITVPVLKLGGLTYLLVSVQRRSPRRRRDRTRLYRIIEGVGRWSMVDIFMISLLAALVQLGTVADIRAELGAVAFAAVVVITMLASESFDPRLIWDVEHRNAPHGRETRHG